MRNALPRRFESVCPGCGKVLHALSWPKLQQQRMNHARNCQPLRKLVEAKLQAAPQP